MHILKAFTPCRRENMIVRDKIHSPGARTLKEKNCRAVLEIRVNRNKPGSDLGHLAWSQAP